MSAPDGVLKCGGCRERPVRFVPLPDGGLQRQEFTPDRCACGALQSVADLPEGELVADSVEPDLIRYWLPRPLRHRPSE